jgi:hypothetical protein
MINPDGTTFSLTIASKIDAAGKVIIDIRNISVHESHPEPGDSH